MSDNYVQIFNSLKTGDLVQLALRGVMENINNGQLTTYVVGRKSRDKYGFEHLTITQVGRAPTKHPGNRMKLSLKGGSQVRASHGDAALMITEMSLPPIVEKVARAFQRKMISSGKSRV
jgi:hypothetical protein